MSVRMAYDLLVTSCPTCGIYFGVPADVLEHRKSHGHSWHCPNGHMVWPTGRSRADLEADLQRERKENMELRNAKWRYERLWSSSKRRLAALRKSLRK